MKRSVLTTFLFVAFSGLSPLFASTNVPANIDANTKWDPSGNPYLIQGKVTVAKGAALEIGPAVKVVFQAGAILEVDGTLKVNGAAANPSVFDMTDGGMQSQLFVNQGSAFLYYIKVQGGVLLARDAKFRMEGSDVTQGSGVYLQGSTLAYLNNNKIYGNATGIVLDGKVRLWGQFNTLVQNTYGLYVKGYSFLKFKNNSIHDNQEEVVNQTPAFNLGFNYWGTTDSASVHAKIQGTVELAPVKTLKDVLRVYIRTQLPPITAKMANALAAKEKREADQEALALKQYKEQQATGQAAPAPPATAQAAPSSPAAVAPPSAPGAASSNPAVEASVPPAPSGEMAPPALPGMENTPPSTAAAPVVPSAEGAPPPLPGMENAQPSTAAVPGTSAPAAGGAPPLPGNENAAPPALPGTEGAAAPPALASSTSPAAPGAGAPALPEAAAGTSAVPVPPEVSGAPAPPAAGTAEAAAPPLPPGPGNELIPPPPDLNEQIVSTPPAPPASPAANPATPGAPPVPNVAAAQALPAPEVPNSTLPAPSLPPGPAPAQVDNTAAQNSTAPTPIPPAEETEDQAKTLKALQGVNGDIDGMQAPPLQVKTDASGPSAPAKASKSASSSNPNNLDLPPLQDSDVVPPKDLELPPTDDLGNVNLNSPSK